MTIDELKKRLNKIDPRLYLECVFSDIDDPNEPTGIWFKAPTKIYWQLFRIDKNDFYFEPLISEIAAVNQFIGLDAVIAIGKLLYKYFDLPDSKESQMISKDSKNENGSTAAFSELASKDSQKKTKEKVIFDFIDEVMNHGFTVKQTLLNHKITFIEIGLKDVSDNLLMIDIDALDQGVFPIGVNKIQSYRLNLNNSFKFSWLLNQSNELIKELEQQK